MRRAPSIIRDLTRRVAAWVVAVIACVVPCGDRARWREEWLAELDASAARYGARAAARVALGLVADARAVRRVGQYSTADERGITMIGFTWLDCRLAARMLVRSPGLTAVGVLGMSAGIAIAAGAFSILSAFMTPVLPFDEGDRIAAIQHVDANRNDERRPWVHELEAWRTELRAVEDLGGFRQAMRNLILPGTAPTTEPVAEISASAFRVTRTGALMGRTLLEADEAPGAPAVLVVGHEVWRSTFQGDPAIIGREVQLGDTVHVVVGVMPPGFAFPVQHSLWVPLRIDASVHPRGQGPELLVFGRLADGATFESAQAELTAIGERTAAQYPSTHERIRPRVVPYTYPFFDIDGPETLWMGRLLQLLLALLLALVSVNVAILFYARTARRQGEIAVRTALGASRGRIVLQLFAESLALATVAAVVGLIATSTGLRYISAAMQESFGVLPFWWRFELSPAVVLYIVLLALLSAVIVGVVPALKATGRRVQHDLQRMSAGGGSGMRLGATWRALIVTQVAFAVALMPAALYQTYGAVRLSMSSPGFAAEEFLAATIARDGGSAARSEDPTRSLYARSIARVQERIGSDPAVAGSTYAMAWPGGEAAMVVEIEGADVPAQEVSYNIREGSRAGHLVGINRVDVGFFATFEVPLLAGRALDAGDASAAATAVVVNRSFTQHLLGDSPALGRRVRYVGRSGDAPAGSVALNRWYDIVGVVADFPAPLNGRGAAGPRLYHASQLGAIQPATLLLRLRGISPGEFAPRLRQVAAAVDPNLQLRHVSSLDALLRQEQNMMRVVAVVLSSLTAAVLLLSSAGIYAMMSFTVSQRRKEIGIRAALGADPRRILSSICARALSQLAAGAAAGIALALLLEWTTGGELMGGHAAVVLPLVVVLIAVIGLTAAVGPARRGLRISPTEALRTT